MNFVLLSGRITREPSVRLTPTGRKVAQYNLAVRKYVKHKDGTGEERTDFIECESWGPVAEVVESHCHKGLFITVKGSLQVSKYDGKDGKKQKKFRVVVDFVELQPDTKKGEKSGEYSSENDGRIPNKAMKKLMRDAEEADSYDPEEEFEEVEIDEEELPF